MPVLLGDRRIYFGLLGRPFAEASSSRASMAPTTRIPRILSETDIHRACVELALNIIQTAQYRLT